jgi:putative redox protein
MELVLMGVAGSAIDMISILKKQRQEISSSKLRLKESVGEEAV